MKMMKTPYPKRFHTAEDGHSFIRTGSPNPIPPLIVGESGLAKENPEWVNAKFEQNVVYSDIKITH